jgi:hypothetical protein
MGRKVRPEEPLTHYERRVPQMPLLGRCSIVASLIREAGELLTNDPNVDRMVIGSLLAAAAREVEDIKMVVRKGGK